MASPLYLVVGVLPFELLCLVSRQLFREPLPFLVLDRSPLPRFSSPPFLVLLSLVGVWVWVPQTLGLVVLTCFSPSP